MDIDVKTTLASHFEALPDPRLTRMQRHDFGSIIIIAICAAICGCDDWVTVARFANAKLDWFKGFFELPNGIPSHDMFSRVISKIDPEAFSACLAKWVQSIAKSVDKTVVAIDGKTLRRSFDRRFATGAIHMVSAWSAENQMVFGQVKVDKKSNEIPAIPELLSLLAIKGAIVTIDAMGCQKAIAQQVLHAEADYVLAVKDNQPSLYGRGRGLF